MSAKHTPGPWEVRERDGVLSIHAPGNTCPAQINGDPSYLPEIRLNARLIAAAPDLLDALVAMLEKERQYMAHQPSLGERCCCLACTKANAKAAIAKATEDDDLSCPGDECQPHDIDADGYRDGEGFPR